ncbi:MAG: alanine racemase, partial [Candidatus Acidiferrales bacterium]
MTKTVHVDGRPVWAEISLQAIRHNLDVVRKQVGADRKILAVVKSNAYGLGAVPIAKMLEKVGVDWFGVTCANEGIELREAGIRGRILVLTGFWPGEETRLIEHELTPTVSRIGDVAHLERAAEAWQKRSAKRARPKKASRPQRLPFHLKINTGMNRLGIVPAEVEDLASELASCKHLELEGTFTHLASSEDFESAQSEDQERVFRDCLDRLKALRVSPGIVHMANSGAICARSGSWEDMVRPGAILYGYHQSFTPPERKREI